MSKIGNLEFNSNEKSSYRVLPVMRSYAVV